MSLNIGGKKFAGKHTTYIDASEKLIKMLVKNSDVKKISLGIIKSSKTGRGARNIKIKPTDSGVELTVRGSSYVQTIWVYLFDNALSVKEKIAFELEELFKK